MIKKNEWVAIGRRKHSSARVRLRPGTGKVIVNGHPVEKYFDRPTSVMVLMQPLQTTDTADKFDVHVLVGGGGKSGQAGAVRHGISRALCDFSPEFRPALKVEGFLTRDARGKERKKYGQRAARARFQFSKR